MDPNFKAEFERQQRKMLEKMSTILNKLESMKHQLEDVSTRNERAKAHQVLCTLVFQKEKL